MSYKIIDRRKKSLGNPPHDRPLSKIKKIANHYTAVKRSQGATIESHENYWKNVNQWDRGGYHYYIDAHARIYQNYDLTQMTWGVANSNDFIVSVAVEAGSFDDYTKDQLNALKWLNRMLVKQIGLQANDVRSHREINNNSKCNGFSTDQMNKWRKIIEKDLNIDFLYSGKVLPMQSNAPTSIEQLAKDTIDGKYGNGEERKKRLGKNYEAVQKRVNEILGGQSISKPQIEKLAQETINGYYGNGEERKKNLGKYYEPVQKRVNEILGSQSISKDQIEQLARDTINGKYGNGQERKKRLGKNYEAVQKRVNEILGV